MAVNKYLDISTGCLPHDEWERMGALATDGDCPEGMIFTRHDYGRWVWVPPADYDLAELTENFPKLADVITYARNSDCAWINFDRDSNDIVEGLPFFEW